MARGSSTEYISAGVTSPTTTATVFISHIGTLVRLELIGFLYTVYIIFLSRASIDPWNTSGQNECESATRYRKILYDHRQ